MPEQSPPSNAHGGRSTHGGRLAVGHPLAEALPHHPASRVAGVVKDLGRLDRAIYGAVADTPTPSLDVPLRKWTTAANYSRTWFATAGVLAVFGGPAGRRAAVSGVASIGAASFIINIGIKPFARRPRPDREGEDVPDEREVPMPGSTSFPSGHSASAFAFATGVGNELSPVGAVLRLAAAWVAYSRVHTGVHYPTDVVIGSVLGGTIAELVSPITKRLASRVLDGLDEP